MVENKLPEFIALLPKVQALLLLSIAGDRAMGTETLANCLVVKIFRGEELDALLQNLLGIDSSTDSPFLDSPFLEWGGLQLSIQNYQVTYHSTPVNLTPKEYEILAFFLRNNRVVYNCHNILENLWNHQRIPNEEAVRTHIKCLRRKLKAAGAPSNFIETVYGFGYRLKFVPSQDPQTVAIR